MEITSTKFHECLPIIKDKKLKEFYFIFLFREGKPLESNGEDMT
jgi:hypothetical protein